MPYAKLLIIALLLGSCSDSAGTDAGDEPTPELERCQTVCVQQLCDPLIDIELDGDPNEVCLSWCQDQREAAREQSCDAQYDELISCLEPLSCEDYMQWRDQEVGAACLDKEEALTDLCTEVEVPRP